MSETVELRHGRITFEERPGYLFIVEEGTLRSVAEVEKYAAAIQAVVERTGLMRVLIDSRGTEPVGRDDGVRDALWKWLVSGRFEQMAFVLSTELQVTSVNMIALSERARIRGFVAVHEAHRWLTGRQRTMSQAMSTQNLPAQSRTPAEGVRAPSSTPPRSALPRSDRPPARPSLRATGEH
nr:STAS/SEC14 domain-containing protein [Myxococcota bacterium]